MAIDLDTRFDHYVLQALRDTADSDYVLARSAYRLQLDEQFNWCALQALEKYLKAILVLNRRSAKNLGHCVHKALRRVQRIDELGFEVSGEVEEFIQHIEQFGQDRYLTQRSFLAPHSLLRLDDAVWSVRRFCFPVRVCKSVRSGEIVDQLETNRERALDPRYLQRPHELQLGGMLEKILDEKLPASETLVWKNFYFGRRKKASIKNYRRRQAWRIPAHQFKSDVLDELRKYMKID